MKNTHRVVYSAANVQQAHMLANALNERGIFAYVTNDLLQGAAGDLPLGLPTSPRVVVHEDEADEARQVVLEFDPSSATADRAAARPIQFGLNLLFYLVTWASVYFAAYRLLAGTDYVATVNVLLTVAFVVVSYYLVARRVAARSRQYPPGDTQRKVTVFDADADDAFDDDEEEDPQYEWPTCPHCDRPRLTSCPICETAGSQFAAAYLPMEAAIADSAAADGGGYHVLCPTCDEAFVAEFPSECEWCGHRFRDGRPLRKPESYVTSPFEDMNPRAWVVLGGLLTTMLAIVGLFVWMVSRR